MQNTNTLKLNENYHTHTYRCKHARGDVADYCQTAIQAGLKVLGISDHTPLPDNRWPEIRMAITELSDYCQSIEAAQLQFGELTVLKGIECDYADHYISFYQDELLDRFALDYLIGAVHFFPHDNEWICVYGGTYDTATLRSYTHHFINAMASGLFALMAHPDLFANAYLTWDAESEACSRAILEAAADLKIPLEINCYGLRKPALTTPTGKRPMYPWHPFWAPSSRL